MTTATATNNQIFQDALALPLGERWDLVATLLTSIETETQPPLDETWMAEIRRRSAEIEAGTAKLYSWDEVKKYARARNGQQ